MKSIASVEKNTQAVDVKVKMRTRQFIIHTILPCK